MICGLLFIKKYKITGKNNFYPGSPLFISSIANEKDKLFFCELHNNEYELLKKNGSFNKEILNSLLFKFISFSKLP